MHETDDDRRNIGALPAKMRAWRVHAWGSDPTEAMVLDTIAVPQPEARELLVRVQAIPLNLNDIERVNGQNMMARPELHWSIPRWSNGLVLASTT